MVEPEPHARSTAVVGQPGWALQGAEEERAVRLHHDALVVDSLGQVNPGVYSADAKQRSAEMLENGAKIEEVASEIAALTNRALRLGQLPQFWQAWRRSGVTVSSVTMGGIQVSSEGPDGIAAALADIATVQSLIDTGAGFIKVLNCADAERAKVENRVGLILNFQNSTAHIGADFELLEAFYNLGVRVIQLTYNSRNAVGDGCTELEPAGLSRRGVDLVGRLNEIGILVDLSHCSEPTALEAVDIAHRPVALTHTFSNALRAHDRGKSDTVIRAVAERGGYVGVCAVPFFVNAGSRASLDDWRRHFNHIVDVAGTENVGVGSDWGHVVPPDLVAVINEHMRVNWRPEHSVDVAATIDGYESWERWPNFTRCLVADGYTDAEIKAFLGGNFLQVFEAATR